ncbi:MAG: hypothetical protein EZS28_031862 [Streblomastix strix]|uniref:Uncharacterized protein n=2 Tax=Streblomastix strix TaxID=222440 RepID=A0A5J4URL8_9EUKA|nr:MAG: hypothetical protein EZS28_031862 [Streblomastix strix]
MTASETASILLTDNKQAAETATSKDGIIDQILKNLQILPVEEIQFYHLLPLYTFFQMIDIDKKRLILDKGVMNMMKSFLNSVCEIVLVHVTYIIYQIFYLESADVQEQVQNQLRIGVQKDGIITKLIKIFNNETYSNIKINQHIALSIGFLFKAAQIPDEFGNLIIAQLEELACKMNSTLSIFALLALDYLAECQCMLQ